jgi:HEXXH motif-containing protein
MTTNWYKMAKPQADGYDTEQLAAMDYTKYAWVYPKVPYTQPVTLCNGKVSVVVDGVSGMGNIPFATAEQASQAWADEQDSWLCWWPDGYQALGAYLDIFQAHLRAEFMTSGCSSGHHISANSWPHRHVVYVTINNFPGCAQGIYHEYAHLRLETMGIGVETHDGRLLQNGPDEVFVSSVRHDKKRPMSAVLHGVYAWLMFTENDWKLHMNGKFNQNEFRAAVQLNLPKIAKGWDEVNSFARWTDEGQEFAAGIDTWKDSLLARCNDALAK